MSKAEDAQTLASQQQSALQQLNTAETERLKKKLELKNGKMDLETPVPDYALADYLKQDPVFQSQMANLTRLDAVIASINASAADEVREQLLETPLSQRASLLEGVRPQAESQMRARTKDNINRLQSEEKVLEAEGDDCEASLPNWRLPGTPCSRTRPT